MRIEIKKIFLIVGLIVSTKAAQAQSTGGCAIAGKADAKVTIEEFADFECQYCARGSKTMQKVLKDYPDKVRLVYRNMPIAAHPDSQVAAKAFSAICLQNPTLAYQFQSELFTHQSELSNQGEAYLYEIAEKIGVDINRMKSDMTGPLVAKSLAEDHEIAVSHSLQGTPSFLIGSETLIGARDYEEFKKVIDRQLNQ